MDEMPSPQRPKAPKWPKPTPAITLTPSTKKTIVFKPRALVCLADVEPEPVKWLWYPYVPAAKLSCITRDPGVGKSWIICAIAAAVSRGEKLPGQKIALPPQKVLLLSAEDGLADTLYPRLAAMGADMNNIFVPDEYFVLDGQGIVNCPIVCQTS